MAENKISMEDKAKLGELFATAIEKGELSEADMENVAGGLKIDKKKLAKGAAAIATAAVAVAGVVLCKKKWDKAHYHMLDNPDYTLDNLDYPDLLGQSEDV